MLDSKQSYAVYRFIISINPSDIAELDATLGNYILHNPLQAAQIFQSVCFVAIKTLSLIEQLQTEAQEDMKFRVLGGRIYVILPLDMVVPYFYYTINKQIVEMIDAKILNALKGYSIDKSHFRIQAFTLFLRDELANKMSIGNHYRIIGIPACVQNGLQVTACIEVNSVQLYKPNVLESRTTTVFIPGKKYGEEADQQVTVSVQTNFWSFVDVDSSSKKHIQKENFLIGQMDVSLIPVNLVDGFGLLIYNEFPSCRLSSPVVHHTLKKAINPEATLYKVSQQFRTQDYEEFILFARNLHAELSSEAESLIQGYYLASRRVRRDSIHGSSLSASALKILISLAKAHAKLSLRQRVLEEDAVIAVLLLESSLTLKHGTSVLCVAPNPVFPFDLSDENCLQERDIYLMQCHHQLLKFITAYSPGIHINTNEE
ncbi:MCM domain-containing protein 2 [Lonchura striata]|uniref:MCM domain-containing protein 2 n=1 Tax=Lonchura striata TaxID=40157 RepID=A0A218VBP0_9PASE|nr:MCM domain-containing protein 2 [Lonchura striata domestica]